jgi:8-oxo-dGTP pyrophosphatase MutT (NUDIX family)
MPYQEYLLPISVKGIVFDNGKVWLRLNERNEWELPGGRLEPGEQPQQTVIRELREELGFAVRVDTIVHAGVLHVPTKNVTFVIITYLCIFHEKIGDFELVGEAGPARFEKFTPDQISQLNMPPLYKEAVQSAISIQNKHKPA